MKRTLLVGLDAACWEYLNPLLQAGQLPNIQKLMDTGAWGVLNSTMPPWTPTAWSSIVTGKNPGKHGVFDMLRREPGANSFTMTDALHRQGTPFWKYLNDAGVRVGLVNVPFTYPPTAVDGFLVCGFGTPGTARDITWPPEALPWIESRFGSFVATVPAEQLRSSQPDEILAAEMQHQASLVEAGIELAERYQVDVLAINLMLTDHANHKMPVLEQVQKAYIQSDDDLGTLLKSWQPDNVLLISDHGSSRLKGDFLLNVWLREHDYCVYEDGILSQQKSTLNWILKEWLQDHDGRRGLIGKALRRCIQFGLPRLPRVFQKRFWAMVERDVPFSESHMRLNTNPDFRRTTLFPGSLYSGLLYFNLSNREPGGVITPADRNSILSRLKAELSMIVDPENGKPLFTKIYGSEEIYFGPAAEHAPDLIADAYLSHWNIRTRQPAPFRGKRHGQYFVTFDHNGDYGWHSPDGVFIFSGSAFQPGQAASPGHVMDVPATLLHLYDIAQPDDWDGSVQLGLFTAELSQRPVQVQPGDEEPTAVSPSGLSSAENESIHSYLRALGYLE